jgi:hypothetical protein
MKTRSKSVTKNQRDKNEKQSSEAIVKKERVKECIPNEDFAVNQTDSFSESSILQLDDTIVVKQEECIDEKAFFIETISAKQSKLK